MSKNIKKSLDRITLCAAALLFALIPAEGRAVSCAGVVDTSAEKIAYAQKWESLLPEIDVMPAQMSEGTPEKAVSIAMVGPYISAQYGLAGLDEKCTDYGIILTQHLYLLPARKQSDTSTSSWRPQTEVKLTLHRPNVLVEGRWIIVPATFDEKGNVKGTKGVPADGSKACSNAPPAPPCPSPLKIQKLIKFETARAP